jgi:hypothetical protein
MPATTLMSRTQRRVLALFQPVILENACRLLFGVARSDSDIGLPTLFFPKLDERIKPHLAARARCSYLQGMNGTGTPQLTSHPRRMFKPYQALSQHPHPEP